MKIVLYGGSFNPFQNGHLALISEIFRQTGADKIWLIPSFNPFKEQGSLGDFDLRVALIKKHIKDTANVEVLEVEKNLLEDKTLGVPFYKTLRKIKQDFPDNNYAVLLGDEYFYTMKDWHNAAEIIENTKFIFSDRNGIEKLGGAHTSDIWSASNGSWTNLDVRGIVPNISATSIRNAHPELSINQLLQKLIDEL
jgi:nicotinate-nucleotide adenylyltransferase